MPRNKRGPMPLAKRYEVFCEGQTEQHYLNGLRGYLHDENPSIRVKIDLTCVGGGGYKSIYKALAKQPDSGCIARFALLDYDRYSNMPAERIWFERLVELSRLSRKSKVPSILIVSNEDFEYTLCCHDPRYQNGDTKQWLTGQWGYSDLGACKSDERIWDKANAGPNSIKNAIWHLRDRKPIIANDIKINRNKLDITLKAVDHKSESAQRTSNLYDLTEVLGIEE